MQDLSLHILDIVENSIRASARRVEIKIEENPEKDMLVLEIKDDGKGMDEQALQQATDPFYTTKTTRRVGLGLSLLAQAARQSEGDIQISSALNQGTTIKADFRLSHPDRKPMGDMDETIRTLVISHPEIDFLYEHKNGDEFYCFDTREVDKK